MKKLYAVIGDPIGHSMSPVMHNDLFSFYGVEADYLPFQVKPGNLKDAVNGFKAIGAGGFNVTVPHKSEIIQYLDEVDELARNIGAVNTVVNQGGRLVGYNTDGPGFLRGLTTAFPAITEKKILVLGAGGAAKAIYFTLAKEKPAVIDIANRTVERAINLIDECPYSTVSTAYSLDEAGKHLEEYDLIVQTTTIGMSPQVKEQPMDLKNLRPQTMVCDIIYNPLETLLLQDARQRGAQIQNGIDMFVFQGALAFEKWTGIFPDVARMREIVLKQLGGK